MSRKEYYINNKERIKEYQQNYLNSHRIEQKIYNSCYCSILKKYKIYNSNDRHSDKYKLLRKKILREVNKMYLDQILLYKRNNNNDCKKIDNVRKDAIKKEVDNKDVDNIILEFI